MSVCAVDIVSSHSTPAGTGTVPSVRRTLATVGSQRASASFYRHATSMLSSRCRMNWRHSPCRISKWFTTYFFESVPRHCLKSLAIRSIWARTSASSVCCIVGIRSSNTIPTSTASFRPADYRQITPIGSHPSKSSFLPVDVLAEVFRGKFTEALKKAFARGKLGFHGSMKPLARPKVFAQLIRQTFRKKWVVYAKRPFGGPEQALRYLGCYTHRVAISNHRLVSFANDQVTFRWRDSAHHNKKRLLTLQVNEFLRRFLLHVLPPGFVRIRHFGFLSTRKRSTLLPLCFRLLGAIATGPETAATSSGQQSHPLVAWLCPHCHGSMLILERWTAAQLRFRAPPSLHSTAA